MARKSYSSDPIAVAKVLEKYYVEQKSILDTSKDLNLNKTTVNKILNADQNRAIIQTIANQFLKVTPDHFTYIIDKIKTGTLIWAWLQGLQNGTNGRDIAHPLKRIYKAYKDDERELIKITMQVGKECDQLLEKFIERNPIITTRTSTPPALQQTFQTLVMVSDKTSLDSDVIQAIMAGFHNKGQIEPADDTLDIIDTSADEDE